MRTSLFLIFLTLFTSPVFAQMTLSMGDHFLAGQDIKKVEVSPEDYTVWALTRSHKLYYKTVSSPTFNLFTPVIGMAIDDMAGYSLDEMYFLVGDVIVKVKSGVITNLAIPHPHVTKINGLAIVSSVYNAAMVNYNLRDGWLMVATNAGVYLLPKNSGTFQQYFTDLGLPGGPNNWDYIRSTFKGVFMRNNIPGNRCTTTPDYSFYNIFDYTLFGIGDIKFTPDQGQFKVSLMPFHSYDLFSGAAYGSNIRMYNVWASTGGLYAAYRTSCVIDQQVHLITEEVNAVAEAMALTQVAPQHYLIAGTNNGLQYTPETIFPLVTKSVNLNDIKFKSFTNFPNVKVNDILIDSRKAAEPSSFIFVCDEASYVATTDGVYQISLSYDQLGYNTLRASEFAVYGALTPTYKANGDAVFDRCANTQPVTVTLLHYATSSVVIKWFKNGFEIPEWFNKQGVTLVDDGTYHAEVNSLCEGVSVRSNYFILQPAIDPELIFNYPDEVPICEGSVYTLTTPMVPGYSYRWLKDGQQMPGITSNSYTATQAGRYQVEVSNCGTFYKSSKIVTIVSTILSAPVITADRPSYCAGDGASLSVTNINAYLTKWYLNGSELVAGAGQNTIFVTNAGAYTVKFLEGNCEKSSLVYNLSFGQPINFTILKSKAGALCYGAQVVLSTSATATKYLWSTGETSPQITVGQAGHYTVKLASAGNCESEEGTDIVILPQVQLSGIDDRTICTIAGEKLRIQAQPGFKSYNWNGLSSVADYLDVTATGTYKLIVGTEDGCTAETTFEVTPWCEQVVLKNTFTPNGDGINDFWEIGGVENDAAATVQVYNRYGQILVDKKISGYKWDGKINGKDVPTGSYYYKISTKNSATPLTGWVAIVR